MINLRTNLLVIVGLSLAFGSTLFAFTRQSLEAKNTTIATVKALPTSEFLDSIGVDTSWPNRGQPLDKTIDMIRYTGIRWVRASLEGLTEKGPTTTKTFLDLHERTGVKLSLGLGSGGNKIEKLVNTGMILADAGALLAFEGNNEPNNWSVTYEGEKGGGGEPSWKAVAKLQSAMYRAVKNEPSLADYPVWSPTSTGAQRDNVGLQFLTIPAGAKTLMPAGTRYADYANVHNYIFHPNAPHPGDNKAWDAADPTESSKIDGLYKNFGVTWAMDFEGYSTEQLLDLPRVTTETGVKVGKRVTEEMHALLLLNIYLAQFKRGYSHTAIYLLRDRTDESGSQTFGFFRPNYSPRKAARYLRNLTTILADQGTAETPGQLAYSIPNQPETVHDLLLRHSQGAFQLIVWGERLEGEDKVKVQFGKEIASLQVYDPTKGVTPFLELSGVSSLDLTLTNHPFVIAIQD